MKLADATAAYDADVKDVGVIRGRRRSESGGGCLSEGLDGFCDIDVGKRCHDGGGEGGWRVEELIRASRVSGR